MAEPRDQSEFVDQELEREEDGPSNQEEIRNQSSEDVDPDSAESDVDRDDTASE